MLNLRDSGLQIIGEVSWGTHIGKFFSTKEDFYNLVPYIDAGLKNNELCMWIYSQNTSYEEIRYILSQYIKNIDYFLEKEQLLLIPYTEWYIEKDTFNEIRTNENWKNHIKKALELGYDGLRAVADTSWLERNYFGDFSLYEQRINKIVTELPFIAICLYDANKLDAFEIAEVIKNHSYILTKHEGKQELIMNKELIVKDKLLQKSEEDYKNLIKLLPSAVFIYDENSLFYCNDAALKLMRLKSREFPLYKPDLRIISPIVINKSRKIIKNLIDNKEGYDCINTDLEYYNGDIKNVEIISRKYNYQGHPAVLSVVVDKSPFEKIKELEKDIAATMKSEKKKTEYLASLSHELRTPINVILGVIQLLEFQNLPANFNIKDSNYLKTMKQNCLRLVRLVNNIIDLTKMDSDFFTIRKENYDVVNLIKDITMSVVEFAAHKGIELTFDSNVDEKIIACDPDQIERIILNLLSNAIKFTKMDGKISVTVMENVNSVIIKIKDNGIGIPKEKLSNIFDRFEQVDKSLRRECEGSGIGLSLVKALVEKHKGKISVQSELCRGSEFTIELPYEVLKDDNAMIKDINFISDYHNYVERINVEFADIYACENI